MMMVAFFLSDIPSSRLCVCVCVCVCVLVCISYDNLESKICELFLAQM